MAFHFKRVPFCRPSRTTTHRSHLFYMISSSTMPPLSASTCHIGVAFYTHRDFPAQWALVLSDNPLFEGHVWCSNAVETMNGWCVSWTPRAWSPAAGSAFDPPVALFSGVVHISQISAPVNHVRAWIAGRNFASEFDRFQVHAADDIPYGTDKYVVLALWRLREERLIHFRELDLKSLASRIGSRLLILQQYPPARTVYPVIPFESENGAFSFGRFTPLMSPSMSHHK
ncbi:hypothetical protein BGW80DRAFT_904826 [Lactifluus volemus]|nr:hypothetical protein BGW80DRAFT_904826 [Lactifluus volemus]